MLEKIDTEGLRDNSKKNTEKPAISYFYQIASGYLNNSVHLDEGDRLRVTWKFVGICKTLFCSGQLNLVPTYSNIYFYLKNVISSDGLHIEASAPL